MPRPPSTPHVLRTARKIRGLTQEKLAQAVAVATITIKEIEAGKPKLSRRLAHRISIATRLDTRQLIENSRPNAPRFYPELYEGFPELIEVEVGQLANVIRSMLKSCKTPTKFFVLRWAIYEKLRELGAEFGAPVRLPAMREVTEAPAAKRQQLRRASPGSGNGEKRSATRSRVPSPRPSRERA